MEDKFKFISCSEDDAISCGAAMFKIQKLKEKIKNLFNKKKLGEDLTNLFKSENLNLNIPAINRQHIGKKGVITGSLDRILYEKWFDEGIPCEILKLRSGGWQKGKVRINLEVSLEFCPDERELEQITEIEEPESPLDDLRRMINDATS
ncbi:KGK domain-containing protein [Anabaena sp. PCC 7108]|uniref:KGK domain-containing protein n=1 Tax=Anabaena sp. PCC 7108 TaxID=163908 RepID=UPI000345B4ED|nr:KGK domain-containing protein [Anabaena sp. PCC 7108]